MKRYLINFFCLFAVVFILLSFPLYLAIQNGLCCYDDVGYAIVAKNLAKGIGYATTINYVGANYSISYFNYAIGEGPVGILPVALVFRLFGFNPFFPGLVQVGIEFLLLLTISLLLLEEYNVFCVVCYMVLSLIVVNLLSCWHYEHLYAMIGEFNAALLVIIGVIFLRKYGKSLCCSLFAGLFFALAVMTKEISAIFVIIFIGYVFLYSLYECLTRRDCIKKQILFVSVFSVGGLAPFSIFELWRLTALGFKGYWANWVQHIHFISSYSPVGVSLNDMLGSFICRSHTFLHDYFLSILFCVFLVVFVTCIIFIFNRNKIYLVATLGLGIVADIMYWVFFTTGPARHLYIGIVVLSFFVPLPALLNRKRGLNFVPVVLLLFSLVPRAGNDFVNKLTEASHDFLNKKPPATYIAEYDMLSYIENNYPKNKILTPWWAHAAMLEFLSPRCALFEGLDLIKKNETNLVLINSTVETQFHEQDKYSNMISKNCKLIHNSRQYSLYLCK